MIRSIAFILPALAGFIIYSKIKHAQVGGDPKPTKAPRVIPKGCFKNPVDHDIVLAGNFCELRPNHFHEGLDIKPKSGQTEPVLAAADGYVSRIFIRGTGYGNAVYVTHPNGFTTTYAHLERLSDKLQEYLRAVQYATQKFDQDLRPDSVLFRVKQGEQIGWMGNTGHSMGRHLHFEVRDTKTGDPINPLLFGLSINDNRAPVIQGIKVYYLDEDDLELESDYYPVKKDESGEYTVGGLMMVKAPRIGLAVHTTDYSDDASNTLGIYNAGLFKNDSMAFEFSMSGYDAPDTKYINAHQDYKEAQSGRRIHRLFRMPGNNLAIYNPKANSGVLKLQAGVETPLSVVVKDYFDNQSVIKLNLAYDSTTLDPPKRIYNYLFPYNEDNAIKDEDFTFFLPKGCLYRKGMIQYSKSPERSSHVHSKLYNLYNATGDPMHGSADVFLPAVNLPDSMKTKAYAVVCNSSGGGATVLDAVWDGDILHAKATRWGSYCIMTDITPPSINFAHKGKKKHLPELTDHITFNFHDNLSGVALWDVWINDQWVLLDYDQKSGTYTYWFDEHVSLVDGDNKVIVQATDKAGNSNVEEYHFNYRK